jgi:mannose-6-phosphate isomerase-like protein (cupin superfamily)
MYYLFRIDPFAERRLSMPNLNQKSPNPPWGRWEVILDESTYKVKRVTVLPGKRLSYQKHFKRLEHWHIVEGRGLVTLNGKQIVLTVGENITIPCEVAHRIANTGSVPLVFIEVQHGSYCGEDDILRLEDDYGRV